ncbi:hypothetical protein ACFOGJ_12145 [Marinibaculum pumilum]|uniref:Enoyl-CoA hydratase/isomerase family protein n=1 Tax=Marinibaculum pumilum TaxID=1766165 RepID=A0ABV7L096_9PROT
MAATAAAAGPHSFADARRRGGVLACNASAALVDLGDGVLGLEVCSRPGLWDRGLADMVAAASDLVRRRQFRALLVGSDDDGVFDVPDGPAAGSAPAGDRAALGACLQAGQQALLALRYADFPVVFAAAGPVAGGGLALLLHADAVVAHAGLRAGFCERRFGLLPGWGGIAQMLVRAQALCGDTDAAARLTLALVAGGRILDDVPEARVCGLLRATDPVVADPALLLPAAKAHALALSRTYARPQAAGIAAAGPAALPALEAEVARLVAAGGLDRPQAEAARAVARIIAGDGALRGTRLSEIDVMRMERDAVLALARASLVRARLATAGPRSRQYHTIE